jgi:hypothetical protein
MLERGVNARLIFRYSLFEISDFHDGNDFQFAEKMVKLLRKLLVFI